MKLRISWFGFLLTMAFAVAIAVTLASTFLGPSDDVEGFGVFGCTPIAYDQALNDIYTPDELQKILTDSWITQTPDQRNTTLSEWDALPCQEQNDVYTQGVAEKAKRAAVDALITPSPQPQNSVAAT